MDIASRIKIFLDTLGIPNSQFADRCGIPRPSLSQLLNGRNKKVSDEVIGKIHDAYPNLSVLWLMFGEGNMTIDGNIELSEAQKPSDTEVSHKEVPEQMGFIPPFNSLFSDQDSVQSGELSGIQTIPSITKNDTGESGHTNARQYTPQPSTLSVNIDNTRRVVSIMVLYSDKSFETFIPKGT